MVYENIYWQLWIGQDRQPKTTKPRSTRLNRGNGQRGDLGGISSLERLTEWDSLESPEGRLLADFVEKVLVNGGGS
jgi:hypothetical protein